MPGALAFRLAVVVGIFALAGMLSPAEAQRFGGGRGFHGGGGGFHGGGFGGRGFYGGGFQGRGFQGRGFYGRGFYGRPVAGVGRWYGGGAWRGPGRYWGGYGYRRYGSWPYGAAVAAPFLGGLALGAMAETYPYTYGYYGYGYPYYPYARAVYPAPVYRDVYAAGDLGGYCRTPVTTCRLINPAEIGGGCSCRVAGGRARGAVIP